MPAPRENRIRPSLFERNLLSAAGLNEVSFSDVLGLILELDLGFGGKIYIEVRNR